jgi:Trk-type K+ transport system membrane component
MLLGRLEIYPILLALVALPLHRPRYLYRTVVRRSGDQLDQRTPTG